MKDSKKKLTGNGSSARFVLLYTNEKLGQSRQIVYSASDYDDAFLMNAKEYKSRCVIEEITHD